MPAERCLLPAEDVFGAETDDFFFLLAIASLVATDAVIDDVVEREDEALGFFERTPLALLLPVAATLGTFDPAFDDLWPATLLDLLVDLLALLLALFLHCLLDSNFAASEPPADDDTDGDDDDGGWGCAGRGDLDVRGGNVGSCAEVARIRILSASRPWQRGGSDWVSMMVEEAVLHASELVSITMAMALDSEGFGSIR